MIPGKGRLFPNHIVRSKKSTGINVLKSAVIYGPNAAGKSNLIKAISFAKNLIVYGTRVNDKIDLKQFRLSEGNINKPSKFQFDIKHNNKYYSYGFILDSNQIHKEWLYEINKNREKLLFRRTTSKAKITNLEFGKNLSKRKENQFLKFVSKGTRPNQLFLTESVQRNVKNFYAVYDWFQNVIRIIFPDSKYEGIEFFFSGKKEIKEIILMLIKYFDTGISDIICDEYLLGDLKGIQDELIERLEKKLNIEDSHSIISSPKGEKYLVHKDEKGSLKALRLTSRHTIKESKEEAIFNIEEESDGTQRILDFLPALISYLTTDCVFFIDEIDRSLHPLLVIKFLNVFFGLSSENNGQLIVTTHDSNLLNLKLLRKDEIWFIEKNKDGESSVYSLEDFKPRYDKDIQKGYLLGRFGAIPFFKNQEELELLKKLL